VIAVALYSHCTASFSERRDFGLSCLRISMARIRVGNLHGAMRSLERAIFVLEELKRLNPSDIFTNMWLADSYRHAGFVAANAGKPRTFEV
jgi:hypothetical protein